MSTLDRLDKWVEASSKYGTVDIELSKARALIDVARAVDKLDQQIKSDPDNGDVFNDYLGEVFEALAALNQPERGGVIPMHEPNERLDAAARLRGTGWFLNPDTCRIEVEPEYVPHVGQHWITLEAALSLGKGDLYEGWKIWHRKKFADEQPERGSDDEASIYKQRWIYRTLEGA